MDFGTLVNCVQVALWLFAAAAYGYRRFASPPHAAGHTVRYLVNAKWLVPALIVAGLLMSGVSLWRTYALEHSYLTFKDIPVSQQQVVEDQTFQDEAVELDGKFFKNCTFTNVRLIYRGQAPFSFSHNEGHGFILDMRHPALQNMLKFLERVS